MAVRTAQGLGSSRRGWGRAAKLVLTIVLVLAAAAGIWLYLNRDRFTVSVGQPGAQGLLADVISRSGLSPEEADSGVTTDPDGATPESAIRTLRVNATAPTIMAQVKRSCRALGFAPPDGVTRSSDPSILCTGRWRDSFAVVSLTTRCGARCDAVIKVELA